MSIHRHAAKRDRNEPQIVKRFKHHGWHCEQVSMPGMPDLLAFNTNSAFHPGARLVDVKAKDGVIKPAQVKKWTALHALGIPVYVVRADADVDALVGGTLQPWEPEPRGGYGVKQSKAALSSRKGDVAKAHRKIEAAQVLEDKRHSRPSELTYTPPRSTPVDAAKEAEAFAPPTIPPCPDCGEAYDSKCYDRTAPTGAVSCTKDVHCIRYEGHTGDCETLGPRCCTT